MVGSQPRFQVSHIQKFHVIIEMTINRQSKDTGGLSGKTENVGASMRWTRINHIMAALRGYSDEIIHQRKFESYRFRGKKNVR